VRWSKLSPARLAIELAKLGIDVDVLVRDARDVPELAPAFRGRKTREERRAIAVEWFGDQRRPQPTKRSEWHLLGRTPDWGQLPRLEGDEPAKHEVRGEPGRPRVLVTKDTLFEIFRQALERARDTAKPPHPYYQQIAAENGVKRTWVTPIVKWVAGHQQEKRCTPSPRRKSHRSFRRASAISGDTQAFRLILSVAGRKTF
jgi:hypothetical protein